MPQIRLCWPYSGEKAIYKKRFSKLFEKFFLFLNGNDLIPTSYELIYTFLKTWTWWPIHQQNEWWNRNALLISKIVYRVSLRTSSHNSQNHKGALPHMKCLSIQECKLEIGQVMTTQQLPFAIEHINTHLRNPFQVTGLYRFELKMRKM